MRRTYNRYGDTHGRTILLRPPDRAASAQKRLRRIENRLAYPSMQVFFYICEYLGVTPSEFFDGGNSAPARRRELHSAVDRLNEAQTELVLTLVRELLNDKGRKP